MKIRTCLAGAMTGLLFLSGCFGAPVDPGARAAAKRERERKIRKLERDADKAFRSPDVKPGKLDEFEYDSDADVDM